jgi:hypothetical protein
MRKLSIVVLMLLCFSISVSAANLFDYSLEKTGSHIIGDGDARAVVCQNFTPSVSYYLTNVSFQCINGHGVPTGPKWAQIYYSNTTNASNVGQFITNSTEYYGDCASASYLEFNLSFNPTRVNATIQYWLCLNITSASANVYDFLGQGVNVIKYGRIHAGASYPTSANYFKNSTQTNDDFATLFFKTYGYGLDYLIIRIYDEKTGTLINQNISIVFSNFDTEIQGSTTNGSFYVGSTSPLALNFSTWTVAFGGANYTTRLYTITYTNYLEQTLNAYLTNSSGYTQLTIKDLSNGDVIEEAFITMYRIINGSWQTLESKYSDVTGKSQFYYSSDVNYKFFVSKVGYENYVFYLNPILFSSYEVNLNPSATIDYEIDYDKLAIIYSPQTFQNNQNTSFNFIISSPNGTLSGYGFNVTYPFLGGTQSYATSGANAIGGQLSGYVNVTGASISDMVRLNYYYISTLGGRRNFTVFLSISDTSYSNNTFVSNRSKTYGLTIFERIFIITLVIVFFCGLIFFIGYPVAGGLLGLCLWMYSVYIGFVPLWAILPSCLMGFFALAWGSK